MQGDPELDLIPWRTEHGLGKNKTRNIQMLHTLKLSPRMFEYDTESFVKSLLTEIKRDI